MGEGGQEMKGEEMRMAILRAQITQCHDKLFGRVSHGLPCFIHNHHPVPKVAVLSEAARRTYCRFIIKHETKKDARESRGMETNPAIWDCFLTYCPFFLLHMYHLFDCTFMLVINELVKMQLAVFNFPRFSDATIGFNRLVCPRKNQAGPLAALPRSIRAPAHKHCILPSYATTRNILLVKKPKWIRIDGKINHCPNLKGLLHDVTPCVILLTVLPRLNPILHLPGNLAKFFIIR